MHELDIKLINAYSLSLCLLLFLSLSYLRLSVYVSLSYLPRSHCLRLSLLLSLSLSTYLSFSIYLSSCITSHPCGCAPHYYYFSKQIFRKRLSKLFLPKLRERENKKYLSSTRRPNFNFPEFLRLAFKSGI